MKLNAFMIKFFQELKTEMFIVFTKHIKSHNTFSIEVGFLSAVDKKMPEIFESSFVLAYVGDVISIFETNRIKFFQLFFLITFEGNKFPIH